MLNLFRTCLGMVALWGVLGGVAIANQSSEKTLSELTDRSIRTYRHTPCNYWRYNSDVVGNVCTFLERNVEVPDAYDLVSVLREMIGRIEALEARIDALESAE